MTDTETVWLLWFEQEREKGEDTGTTDLQQLNFLSKAIRNYWQGHASHVPIGLNELPGTAYADPVTREPFEYHTVQGSQYQLCAVFTASSPGG